MKDKVKGMGEIFSSTWKLYSNLDQNSPQASYIHIPKQDRKMIKMLYELYDMGRFSMGSYSVFVGMVLRHSINANLIPVVACQELCDKTQK